MSAEDQKRRAGEAAAAEVKDGMAVGLGTGSTAAWFVRALGARAAAEGLKLRCVATSEATGRLAAQVGLTCEDLDELGRLDLTVDGADEIGHGLALIKGGGGALLREKLVWSASDRCIVVGDAAKRVERLGAFPLPIEVVAFGHTTTARRLAGIAEVEPVLRMRDQAPFVTDNGNMIYDLPLGEIGDVGWWLSRLKAVTGVVDHGLFVGLADLAFIGLDDRLEVVAA